MWRALYPIYTIRKVYTTSLIGNLVYSRPVLRNSNDAWLQNRPQEWSCNYCQSLGRLSTVVASPFDRLDMLVGTVRKLLTANSTSLLQLSSLRVAPYMVAAQLLNSLCIRMTSTVRDEHVVTTWLAQCLSTVCAVLTQVANLPRRLILQV